MTKYDSNSKRVDYKLIEWLLANMDTQTKLYKLVKAEMVKRGNWKAKSRGKPFTSGQDERRGDIRLGLASPASKSRILQRRAKI